VPNIDALLEAATPAHQPGTRENPGHAIGVVLGTNEMLYTRAIFDYKTCDSGDTTHWGDDDVGDEYLRNFTQILRLPTDGAQPSVEADFDETADTDLFTGHLFVTDDPTPKPIVATLVRNKQGRWIGENVLDVTKELVTTMTEELPPMIFGQIYEWRQLEAEREEKEKEKFEMDKWHAELEKREEAVQKMEEELHEKEMRLRAAFEG
tara:strand:- start:27267 stop:27887 length:621 start_codon:yes stop_codon:yes gene_type:complete